MPTVGEFIKKPWVWLVGGLVLLLCVAGAWTYFGPFQQPRPRGRIFIGSPEIYTRERLVNDRSEQEEWLRDQLVHTDTLDFGVQGVLSRRQRAKLSLAGTLGADAPAAEASASPSEPPRSGAARPVSAPIDAYHDRAAYRDEVRAELIENQLDDRHDLDGNTLYRLNFDLAVVPSHGNRAYAVVEVKVARYADDAKKGDGADEAVYADWLTKLLADAKATFRKREQEAWAAVVAGESERQEPRGNEPRTTAMAAIVANFFRVGAPLSSDVQEDLRAVQQDCRKDKTLADACGGPDGDADAALPKSIACLITEQLKDQPPTKRGMDGREASFRERFASVFAARMSKHYGELARFGAEKGDLTLKNLPGAPDDAFKKGYAEYRNRVVRVSTVYAYAVAPKESFDRIDADFGRSTDLGLAVAAAPASAGPSRAALSATTALAREQSASAIERNPRVVGFTGLTEDAAHFGWIIGPRFRPGGPGGVEAFEQPVGHYVVSAIISAPAWWTRAHVSAVTYWYDGRSDECFGEGGERFPWPRPEAWSKTQGLAVTDFEVLLPVDPRPLGDILLANEGHSGADALKQPAIDKDRMEPVRLAVGSKAEIVVPGHNLWRNPVVMLGAQQATRVKLLPNMNGLVAYFDEITAPPGWDGAKPYEDVTLTVWTSQKNADSVKGKVVLYPKRSEQADPLGPPSKTPIPPQGRQASPAPRGATP